MVIHFKKLEKGQHNKNRKKIYQLANLNKKYVIGKTKQKVTSLKKLIKAVASLLSGEVQLDKIA